MNDTDLGTLVGDGLTTMTVPPQKIPVYYEHQQGNGNHHHENGNQVGRRPHNRSLLPIDTVSVSDWAHHPAGLMCVRMLTLMLMLLRLADGHR